MKRNIAAFVIANLFACTAALAVPPQLPPQLQEQANELLKACSGMGGDKGTLEDGYATSADFNGDGVDDYVLDDGALYCGKNGGHPYSGSAGSPVSVWLSQPDGSWKLAKDIGGYMQDWEIKRRNGKSGIEYMLHGSMCGKGRAGSDGCVKFWTAPQAKAGAARNAHASSTRPPAIVAAPPRKEAGGYYDRSAARDDGASAAPAAPCVPPKPPKRHGGVHGLLDRLSGKTNAPRPAGDCAPASTPQPAPAREAQATQGMQPSVPPAPPDNPAAIDRAVKAYIARLDKQLAENQEKADPKQIETADLDGDGRAEVVLLYATYGPTFWDAGLTVFTERGEGYVVAAESNDALGNTVEGIDVRDGLIYVNALWEGPDDARCCPSVKRTTAYRWQGKKLVKLASAGGR